MERGLGHESLCRMLPCSPSRVHAGVWGFGLAFGLASGAWPLRVLGQAVRRPRLLCSHRCRAGLARCGARLARRRLPRQQRSTKPSGNGTWPRSRLSPSYAPLQPIGCACGRVGLWAGLWSRLGRLAASGAWTGGASPEAAVLAPLPCGPCAMRRAVGSQALSEAIAFNQALGTWNVARVKSLSYVCSLAAHRVCMRAGGAVGWPLVSPRALGRFGCLGRRCVARGCCARTGAVRALRDAARGWLAGV
jgi:hypothetical protein